MDHEQHRSTAPRRRGRGDQGAVLVEMGLIAPLLFLILFGIVEFGWAFSQHLDVRHGAREGARLAAVNYDPLDQTGSAQALTIAAATCQRMSPAGAARVRVTLLDPARNYIGDRARIEVESDLDLLTGMLDFVLADTTLTSKVEFRLEQGATWSGDVGWVVCP